MSALDFVKRHPVGVGVGAIVIIGAVVLASGGLGGSSAAAPAAGYSMTGGDASTGQALQLAQLQATAQANQTDAQKAVALDTNATNIAIAQIQASLAGQGLQVQQTLGSMQIQSDQAVAINGATLQAQTANAQTAAQAEAQKEAYGTINAQTQALVTINQQNNQPKGLFGWLFG